MVTRRPTSPGCLALFGAVFLGLASVFLVMGVTIAYKAGYAQRNYRAVTGHVDQSYITESRSSKGRISYIRHIRYSYPCGRDQCEGSTIGVTSFQSTNMDWQATRDWLSAHPAGSSIQVYYDPNSPNTSALEIGLGAGIEFLLLFPMLHWMVGVSIILSALPLGMALRTQIIWRSYVAWGLISLLLVLWAGVPLAGVVAGHAVYFGLGLLVARVANRRNSLTIVR